MKSKLLLDDHIDDPVAAALRRKFPSLDVVSIYETHLAGRPDPTLAGGWPWWKNGSYELRLRVQKLCAIAVI